MEKNSWNTNSEGRCAGQKCGKNARGSCFKTGPVCLFDRHSGCDSGSGEKHFIEKSGKPAVKEIILTPKTVKTPPEYDVQLLDVNEYSRPGIPLEKVRGIVVHYTANPGTSAQNNRDYFQGLSLSGENSVSSHFVVGIEGEVIQCVPCNEVAYASNDRNSDTISIECCHTDESGKFSDSTYKTLVHLTAWLMGRYDLKIDDVIRHYDVTGKNCPKYFVEYPLAWEQFKKDVNSYIDSYGTREPLEEESSQKKEE